MTIRLFHFHGDRNNIYYISRLDNNVCNLCTLIKDIDLKNNQINMVKRLMNVSTEILKCIISL